MKGYGIVLPEDNGTLYILIEEKEKSNIAKVLNSEGKHNDKGEMETRKEIGSGDGLVDGTPMLQ